jgi:hypothetical protein
MRQHLVKYMQQAHLLQGTLSRWTQTECSASSKGYLFVLEQTPSEPHNRGPS